MYRRNRILALITARGGSKGIPRKNIKPLGGKPLICWTIDAAMGSKYIDRLILSSDDEEIIHTAENANCEVPFVRPYELARDETSSMDVILHALAEIKESYEYLLLLQPTSPFRTAADIDGIIETCINKNAKMMVSVARLKKHPAFMYHLKGPYLESFFDVREQLRRQDMPTAYEHNGALYISTVEFIKKVKSYNVPEAMAFEMHGMVNIDIDEPTDWEYAEYLLFKKHKNQ